MARSGSETTRHRELKRLALTWAQAQRFRAAATEVRVPRTGFRADVAACVVPAGHDAVAGESAIFECKQARADLLRDAAPERAVTERLRVVLERRRELEALLGLHLPSLRRGESLFPEYDTCDLDAIRHDGLRAVRREEALLQSKLYGGTKLARLWRYRSADRLYLVVEPGVLDAHEVPEGWGLLVRAGEMLELVRTPARLEATVGARLALLQAVALAASRAVNDAAGVAREAILAHHRERAREAL